MSNLAKAKTYTAPAATGAQPDGVGRLTNGVFGIDFVGYSSSNPVVVIDLGTVQTVRSVHVYLTTANGASLPSSILIEVGNGTTYTTLGTVAPSGSGVVAAKVFLSAGVSGRYVRVSFTSSSLVNVGEIAVYDDAVEFPLEMLIWQEVAYKTEPCPMLAGMMAMYDNAAAYLALPMLVLAGIDAITTITPMLEGQGRVDYDEKALLLNVQAPLNKRLSEVITYENGFWVARVTLAKPAGMTGYLSKSKKTIGDVVNSLEPKTQHVLYMPLISERPFDVDVNLEVVNA